MVGRGYVMNVGRGYVIQNGNQSVREGVTKVGIELLGQLKNHPVYLGAEAFQNMGTKLLLKK